MSEEIQTITEDELRTAFRSDLARSGLSFAEFIAMGEDCTRKCGCSLRDLPEKGDSMVWWFKNRDVMPWMVEVEENQG